MMVDEGDSTTTDTAGTAGPWEQMFTLEVPFAFKSKSNFRRSTGASRGEWAAQRGFEDDLHRLATAARPDGWVIGSPDDALPLRPVVVALICAKTLLDAANLSKSVLDACEGVVFVNDASVAMVSSLAQRTGSEVGGEVLFCRLKPGSSQAEVIEASVALQLLWVSSAI